MAELVDAAPDSAVDQAVMTALDAVPGVRDVHDLRLRQTGGAVQADVHLGLDPDLTLSEAHRLSEAARARVLDTVPAVDEIVIHAEPHGHADGFGAHRAALRPAARATVVACLDGLMPESTITALHLDYRNDGSPATVALAPSTPPGVSATASERRAVLHAAGQSDILALRQLSG